MNSSDNRTLVAFIIIAVAIVGMFLIDTIKRNSDQSALSDYKSCVNNAISNTESPNISIDNYANPIDYGNDIEYKLRDDIISNANKCN